MSKLWSVALSNVTVGWSAFQALLLHVFSVINLIYDLRFFLKKTIFFKDSREGPTFSGWGGQTLPRGGGGGGEGGWGVKA